MARPTFKQWWTKKIPPVIERSTYVLVANLFVILLIWQWQPMPGVIWDIQWAPAQTALWVLFGLGWLLIVFASLLINHFDLFGTPGPRSPERRLVLARERFVDGGRFPPQAVAAGPDTGQLSAVRRLHGQVRAHFTLGSGAFDGVTAATTSPRKYRFTFGDVAGGSHHWLAIR